MGMKEKLQEAGFYTGPIDDEVSTEFTDAVKKFQKAMGAFPDGMYGPATARLIDEFLSHGQERPG
jgi:peptidoglycan hydrolase-like protein with peptidoglycan-binding domain